MIALRMLPALLVLPLAAWTAPAVPTVVDVTPHDPFSDCSSVQSAGSADNAFEPQIALDPRTASSDRARLVGVWQQDFGLAGAAGIAAAYSDDGGATWQQSPLPFTTCVSGGLANPGATDPWVSIGPDGTVYASAFGLSPTDTGISFRGVLAAVSHDGGQTWSHAQAIPGTVGKGIDKDSITADPSLPGVAYAVWAMAPKGAATASEAALSMTTDSGATWSKPRIIVHPAPGVLWANDNQILVDPHRHVLYDVFYRLKKRSRKYIISIVRSNDSGVHWSKPATVAVAHPGRDAPQARSHLGWPSEAIDPTTGEIYVIWENDRSGRVTLRSSKDGGQHWSKAHSVGPGAGIETLPAVAVGTHGTVYVQYDSVLTAEQGYATTVSLAVSHDHGAHFHAPMVIAGPTNLITTGPHTGAIHVFVGDYEGLTAGERAYPFFALADGDPAFHTHIYSSAVAP